MTGIGAFLHRSTSSEHAVTGVPDEAFVVGDVVEEENTKVKS